MEKEEYLREFEKLANKLNTSLDFREDNYTGMTYYISLKDIVIEYNYRIGSAYWSGNHLDDVFINFLNRINPEEPYKIIKFINKKENKEYSYEEMKETLDSLNEAIIIKER